MKNTIVKLLTGIGVLSSFLIGSQSTALADDIDSLLVWSGTRTNYGNLAPELVGSPQKVIGQTFAAPETSVLNSVSFMITGINSNESFDFSVGVAEWDGSKILTTLNYISGVGTITAGMGWSPFTVDFTHSSGGAITLEQGKEYLAFLTTHNPETGATSNFESMTFNLQSIGSIGTDTIGTPRGYLSNINLTTNTDDGTHRLVIGNVNSYEMLETMVWESYEAAGGALPFQMILNDKKSTEAAPLPGALLALLGSLGSITLIRRRKA